MTKERKLAIDMWLWIREHYDDWDGYFWASSEEDGFVEVAKTYFLEEENAGEAPKWLGMCWLCTYMRNPAPDCPEKFYSCERCPLKSCLAPGSAYQVLDRHLYKGDTHVSKEVYRKCCTTILKALGYKGE